MIGYWKSIPNYPVEFIVETWTFYLFQTLLRGILLLLDGPPLDTATARVYVHPFTLV